MRVRPRNAILVLTAGLLIGLTLAGVREDAAGRAPAPARRVLRGVIKLKGDLPDLDTLNKRHLEALKRKDGEYCLKGDESEKTDPGYRLGGKDNRQVGNVCVWLTPEGDPLPVSDKQREEAKKREVAIRVRCCSFVPHCLFLFSEYVPDPEQPQQRKPTGQVLKLANDARIVHNFRWSSGRNKGGNILLVPNTDRVVNDLQPDILPVILRCSIHQFMGAYIWVVDTPYYAISLSDTLDARERVKKEDAKFGSFEIPNPPAGKVRIHAWHERVGWLNENRGRGEILEIKGSGATVKDFELRVRNE